MDQLSGVHILIVDDNPPTSCDLRSKLVRHGAIVHVASSAKAALLMVKGTRISVAFVPYCRDEKAIELREALNTNNIPQIFTGGFVQDPSRANLGKRWERAREPEMASAL